MTRSPAPGSPIGRLASFTIVLALSAAGCTTSGEPATAAAALPAEAATTPTTPPAPSTNPSPTAPEWLGQRTLPTDADGFGERRPTPPELADRRFPTVDTLAVPPDDRFTADIAAFEGEALARSTWQEGCPVAPEALRHVTVAFWGFDGRNHRGELVVAAEVADDVVTVFAQLHDARFPIEEMRIVTPGDLTAPPTGDGNNTASFVCRPVTGGSGFSQHAYGLAIDLDPFHNPYERGDLVLPELAAGYLDRDHSRPGVILDGDVAVTAFESIGWHWGGRWETLKDYQHFSLNNR